MIDSFYVGASGMNVQQTLINTISNNVSNVSTHGFKKGRVSFEDLFYRKLNSLPTTSDGQTAQVVGLGAAIASTDKVFTQGDLVQTGNALDIAIQGAGFLQVVLSDGSNAYLRPGSLKTNEKGELVTQDGAKLASRIDIPPDATKITITPEGEVTATIPNQLNPQDLGQLELANFVNPEGLHPLGGGLYAATEASGEPFFAQPGQNGLGTLSQGYLEASNVDIVSELVDLVAAQRAYQLNSKVLQVSDDILATINSLRR